MAYHPVDKERYDVAAFDKGQSYIGTEWADKVEDFGRNIVSGLQAASQDQEGIGDDILRFGGKLLQGAGAVAEAPVIKQGLQLLDAPVHYLAEGAGNIAEKAGVDPRLAKWGVRAAETALTMGGGIAKKTGKLDDLARIAGNQVDDLTTAAMNRLTRKAQPVYANFEGSLEGSKKINKLNKSNPMSVNSQARRADEIAEWNKKRDQYEELFKNEPKGRQKRYYYKKLKESRRRIVDAKVRDLGVKRDFYAKNAPLKAGFDRHHLAGLQWSLPFFEGLSEADAIKLSAFARKHGVEFGDTLKNRRDISKINHTGKNGIHVWLNEHAIDHPPLHLKGTSLEVRMKEMQKMITDVKRQVIKLEDIESGVPKDLLDDPINMMLIKPSIEGIKDL